MSSGQQMPPWLQEQLMKMQQSQQNLQSIMAQKQQLDMEIAETDKALEELKKVSDDDTVYKHAGSILIKSVKKDLIAELEEKKELANTRTTVLAKQRTRIEESLKEQEAKITEMMKGGQSGTKPQPSSKPQDSK
ncbi:MAG: prefoldin subunit beta [Crenarchaeota archaeon]|nr:MAG: prefoldin subunit beta [Thermoproteota archaeon]RDJ33693.1 MAG: prefoldin subunit beta [Thermoproteota archaeon]RDJ37271.1 MAG: prefoldin subunit beta [Thermoproteota archaeon]RDJ39225.1 MAG: prefoldin subunit beta [Thermoproteota archaeon]